MTVKNIILSALLGIKIFIQADIASSPAPSPMPYTNPVSNLFQATIEGDTNELRDIFLGLPAAAAFVPIQDDQGPMHPDTPHPDGTGTTPLMLAPNAATARLLLQHGASPNAKNASGETPLVHATKEGNVGTAEVLLERPEILDEDKNESLIIAALNDHADLANLLIENGADIYAEDPVLGDSPLTAAARQDNVATVQALLGRGVDPNKPNVIGYTALEDAVAKQNIATANILLENNATVTDDVFNAAATDEMREILYSKMTQEEIDKILISAARQGKVETIKFLLNKGGNPNLKDDQLGDTLLTTAVDSNHPEVVEALLQLDANPDMSNAVGYRALEEAVANNYTSIVEILLKHGAEITPDVWKEVSIPKVRNLLKAEEERRASQ